MGIIIFLSFKLGEWLDVNYPSNTFYYSKLITIIGVFIALYNVYRQVQQIGEK